MLTVSQLAAERVALEWVAPLRVVLLASGSGFSAWLGLRLIVTRPTWPRLLAYAVFMASIGLIDAVWVPARLLRPPRYRRLPHAECAWPTEQLIAVIEQQPGAVASRRQIGGIETDAAAGRRHVFPVQPLYRARRCACRP